MKKTTIWTLIGRLFGLRWLFLVVFIGIMILVCSQIGSRSENRNFAGFSSFFHSSSIPCHMINHEAGETCVPNHPQRIVVLTDVTLANVLALDIKPIGMIGADFPPYLQQASDIQVVGEGWEPSFEKILLVKPDLIIGTEYHRAAYKTLAKIAPTVILKWSGTPSWKQHLEDVARVLNKTEEAKLLMQNYYQRLEKFRQEMGDHRENLLISYVDILVGYIWCDVKNSFAGTILNDAGLKRPAAQEVITPGGLLLSRLLQIMPLPIEW